MLALFVLGSAMAPFAHAQGAVVATGTVEREPYGTTYDSGRGEVFVGNVDSGTVSVVSDTPNKVVATVTVGSDLQGLAYDSGNGEVFVATVDKIISVISDSNDSHFQDKRGNPAVRAGI